MNFVEVKIFNGDSKKKMKDVQEEKKPFGDAFVLEKFTDFNAVQLNGDTFKFPLLEDVVISAKSNMSTVGELIPQLDWIKKIETFTSSLSNQVGTGVVKTVNGIDAPRWQNTEPFRLSLKLKCYLVKNAKKDVFFPATLLQEQSILSRTSDGEHWNTPGISANTLKLLGSFDPTKGSKKILENSKLVSINIPNVIYIPMAIVESAVPTFSKERAESGFPIWADIDFQVVSVLPANSDFYDNVLTKGFPSAPTGVAGVVEKGI